MLKYLYNKKIYFNEKKLGKYLHKSKIVPTFVNVNDKQIK